MKKNEAIKVLMALTPGVLGGNTIPVGREGESYGGYFHKKRQEHNRHSQAARSKRRKAARKAKARKRKRQW